VISPAFPRNTARSGVLYPLALSMADSAGAKPDQPERRRLGAFLMYSGIASLSVSSALWLTAMAANPPPPNMNANEVIANRALELMGHGKRGLQVQD
jgi:DASS family divalent anion:Na+ symporter